MKKSWLEQLAEKFEAMNFTKQAGTIAMASALSVATVAVTVPDSNLGRYLRAEVDSPPTFSIEIPDEEDDEIQEEEEAPPSFDISTTDEEEEGANEEEEVAAPCTEEELQNDDSELCIDGEFVVCDEETEGDTNDEETYICSDEVWEEYEEEVQAPEEDELIEIEDHSADPEPFNPVIEELEINFDISADAIIKLTINNISDEELITLIDDEELAAGDYDITWKGTDDNTTSGNIFPSGVYNYKILAKNTDTSVTEDTAEGSITIVFDSVGDDPEDEVTNTENSSTDNSSDSEIEDEDTDLATQVMTNTTEGETSDTGPGVLIYAVFPLIGYIVTKRRHARR